MAKVSNKKGVYSEDNWLEIPDTKTHKRPPRVNEGRPSKYDPKYIESVLTYLAEHVDTKDEKGHTVKLPTVEGFARYIGVNKTTLYEWEQAHKEFSNSLDHIRTEQQERLLNKGLSGDYNPTIAKLILSSNHGMREKSDTDITTGGKAIQPVLVKFIGDDD